jgi:hypothetical protein
MTDYKYSLSDLEERMLPWERQLYVELLMNKIKEMEEANKS